MEHLSSSFRSTLLGLLIVAICTPVGAQNRIDMDDAVNAFTSTLMNHRNGSDPRLGADRGFSYCIPNYINGTNDGDFIDGVVLGDINNTATGATGGPSDTVYFFDGNVTRLIMGSTYSIDITSGDYFADDFAAWIDFDGSSEFDASEKLGEFSTTIAYETQSINFTVPYGDFTGYTRLRVRCEWNGAPLDPCLDGNYGEIEDYYVLIENSDCIPLFTFGTTDGDFIAGIDLDGTVAYNGFNGTIPYSFSNIAGHFTAGSTQTVTVTAGDFVPDWYSIWVDWDQDGTFDHPSEQVGVQSNSTPGQALPFSVNVPSDFAGYTRMRVKCAWNGSTMDPCSDHGWGETVDLVIAVDIPNHPCLTYGGFGSQYGDFIDAVQIQGETFSTGPGSIPYHSIFDMNNPVARVSRGTVLDLVITSGEWIGDVFEAYLDLNGDRDLDDPGEFIGSFTNTLMFGSQSFSFLVPMNASVGQQVLRIRCYDPFASSSGPCEDTFYGEVEDYQIVIDGAAPCIPGASFWTRYGDFIDGVELGSISNLNTGGLYSNAYKDYTSLSTDLAVGMSHSMDITSGQYTDNEFYVWIDLNADGDWDDAGEYMGMVGNSTSFEVMTLNFSIPSGTPLGTTQMRIRCLDNDVNIGPCIDDLYGETEDYSVVLTTSTNIASATNDALQVIPLHGTQQLQVLSGQDWMNAQLTLTDMLGKVIVKARIEDPTEMVALPVISKGTYLVTLALDGRVRTERFVWSDH